MDYFSSGPIVAMVWEGPDAILTGRKMLGATNPNSSDPGKFIIARRASGLRVFNLTQFPTYDPNVVWDIVGTERGP